MSIHNEGWQNQRSVARNIHEQGQQSAKDSAKAEKSQAAKLVQNLHSPATTEAKNESQASDAVRQPVQAGKDVAPTIQKTRMETQDQAARQSQSNASNEFLKARDDSRQLNFLSKKTVTTAGDAAAVNEAVVQKGQTGQADLHRQNAQQPSFQMAHAADKAARQAARQVAARHIAGAHRPAAKGTDQTKGKVPEKGKEQPGPETAMRQDASGAARAAHPAAPAVSSQVAPERPAGSDRRGRDEGPEGGVDRKEKGSETRSGGGVYASKSNAGRDLGALLGGSAGGSSDGQNGQEAGLAAGGAGTAVSSTDAAGTRVAEELPEVQPGFHIYNEFDEANPGLNVVLPKAMLYAKNVEKRLVEIAELDRNLNLGIMSFSQKIICEDEELAQSLKLAMFERKSVIGGLIG